MAKKRKKQKMEFRYYQLPLGSPILALLGEKWKQTYGYKTGDLLHFHNYLEIGYCYYGRGIMRLGDEECRFMDKQFTIIPPNFPHTTNSDKGTVSKWEYLFVDVDNLLNSIISDNVIKKENMIKRIYSKALILNESDYPKEAEKILEIIDIMRNVKEFYIEEATGIMTSFMVAVARMNRLEGQVVENEQNGKIITVISNAMDYISYNYMEDIRIEDVARYNHLSETHFRRVFSEYMNMSPLEYINTVRIRTACEHLKKTDASVAEIAGKCGFTTLSTFNRNFKHIMGETPVEWRKRPENYEHRLLDYEIHTEKGW